uniref:Uncharacterized protein n=1 Tax=Schlesneria paludicola TaxID=360056 RepID=A0A7C4LJ03_9PLAN
MADAASRDRWQHTASLMALLANAHRDPKKTRPLKPIDFHPHRKPSPKPPAPPKADISVLKTVFVDRETFPRGDR